jgi:hypothetical protein
MLTSEQIEQERKREQEFNKLSDSIIGVMPFGKFYGLMQTASKMGDSMLKKSICIDPDGRIVASYKTDFGKIAGAWLKPQHEIMTENLAKKKYGKAFLGSIPIVGQIVRAVDQKKLKKKGRCFNMTIEEFMAEQKKREELEKAKLQTTPVSTSLQTTPNAPKNEKFLGMPKSTGIVVATLVVFSLIGVGTYLALKKK